MVDPLLNEHFLEIAAAEATAISWSVKSGHTSNMNHQDHVRLIDGGISAPGGTWADLGAGSGAFTLALREVAGATVEIYAVDLNRPSLESMASQMQRSFPGTHFHLRQADFTQAVNLPELDGIVAANSLHYVKGSEQGAVLGRWRSLLKPGGRLILLEYDTDLGNQWVPFPISYRSFRTLATEAGFVLPGLLAAHPSRFMHQIYSALAMKPAEIG